MARLAPPRNKRSRIPLQPIINSSTSQRRDPSPAESRGRRGGGSVRPRTQSRERWRKEHPESPRLRYAQSPHVAYRGYQDDRSYKPATYRGGGQRLRTTIHSHPDAAQHRHMDNGRGDRPRSPEYHNSHEKHYPRADGRGHHNRGNSQDNRRRLPTPPGRRPLSPDNRRRLPTPPGRRPLSPRTHTATRRGPPSPPYIPPSQRRHPSPRPQPESRRRPLSPRSQPAAHRRNPPQREDDRDYRRTQHDDDARRREQQQQGAPAARGHGDHDRGNHQHHHRDRVDAEKPPTPKWDYSEYSPGYESDSGSPATREIERKKHLEKEREYRREFGTPQPLLEPGVNQDVGMFAEIPREFRSTRRRNMHKVMLCSPGEVRGQKTDVGIVLRYKYRFVFRHSWKNTPEPLLRRLMHTMILEFAPYYQWARTWWRVKKVIMTMGEDAQRNDNVKARAMEKAAAKALRNAQLGTGRRPLASPPLSLNGSPERTHHDDDHEPRAVYYPDPRRQHHESENLQGRHGGHHREGSQAHGEEQRAATGRQYYQDDHETQSMNRSRGQKRDHKNMEAGAEDGDYDPGRSKRSRREYHDDNPYTLRGAARERPMRQGSRPYPGTHHGQSNHDQQRTPEGQFVRSFTLDPHNQLEARRRAIQFTSIHNASTPDYHGRDRRSPSRGFDEGYRGYQEARRSPSLLIPCTPVVLSQLRSSWSTSQRVGGTDKSSPVERGSRLRGRQVEGIEATSYDTEHDRGSFNNISQRHGSGRSRREPSPMPPEDDFDDDRAFIDNQFMPMEYYPDYRGQGEVQVPSSAHPSGRNEPQRNEKSTRSDSSRSGMRSSDRPLTWSTSPPRSRLYQGAGVNNIEEEFLETQREVRSASAGTTCSSCGEFLPPRAKILDTNDRHYARYRTPLPHECTPRRSRSMERHTSVDIDDHHEPGYRSDTEFVPNTQYSPRYSHSPPKHPEREERTPSHGEYYTQEKSQSAGTRSCIILQPKPPLRSQPWYEMDPPVERMPREHERREAQYDEIMRSHGTRDNRQFPDRNSSSHYEKTPSPIRHQSTELGRTLEEYRLRRIEKVKGMHKSRRRLLTTPPLDNAHQGQPSGHHYPESFSSDARRNAGPADHEQQFNPRARQDHHRGAQSQRQNQNNAAVGKRPPPTRKQTKIDQRAEKLGIQFPSSIQSLPTSELREWRPAEPIRTRSGRAVKPVAEKSLQYLQELEVKRRRAMRKEFLQRRVTEMNEEFDRFTQSHRIRTGQYDENRDHDEDHDRDERESHRSPSYDRKDYRYDDDRNDRWDGRSMR